MPKFKATEFVIFSILWNLCEAVGPICLEFCIFWVEEKKLSDWPHADVIVTLAAARAATAAAAATTARRRPREPERVRGCVGRGRGGVEVFKNCGQAG